MASIVAAPSRAAAPPAPPATLHESGGLLEVQFHLPCASGASTSAKGVELLIRLNCPLEDEQADALSELADDSLAAGQLEEIRTGYDTVLLRATRGVWQVENSADGLIARSLPQGDSPAERRLRLIAARAQVAQGEIASARSQIEALRLEAPDDADIAAALAEIYYSEGRWADARNLYKQALANSPTVSLQQAIAEIDRERASRISIDISGESSTNGTFQMIEHLEARWEVGEGWQASVHHDLVPRVVHNAG